MDKSLILSQFSFFGSLPHEVRQKILDAAIQVRLAEGEFFYREDDDMQRFALVGAGSIRVFKTGETGREVTLYHVRAGQTCLVNLISVLLRRKALANACADSDTDTAVLPASLCRDLVAASGAVRHFVFESMALRLVDLMTLAEEVIFRKVDSRLAGFLWGRFENRGRPLREIAMTHEEIATELGTAREVVSRLLKEFERAGAISLSRGRIDLRDASCLRALEKDRTA